MDLDGKTKEELEKMQADLFSQKCINSLEGMFSQKACWHCNMIQAISHELQKRTPVSAATYGAVVRFSKEELLGKKT